MQTETDYRAPLYLRTWGWMRNIRKIVRTIVWYAGLILIGFYFVTGQALHQAAQAVGRVAAAAQVMPACNSQGASPTTGALWPPTRLANGE
jgi:hypothetical protein